MPVDEQTRLFEAPVATGGVKRDRAYLVVLAGASVGEMYKIDGEKTVIGRGQKAQIRLYDDGISREHAQILVEGNRIFLQDLGSTNGTYCNGLQVDKKELVDGDKILVGSTTILKFTYHDNLDEIFQRQMYESALRDGLTKAFNKKYFTDRLESESLAFHERVRLGFLDLAAAESGRYLVLDGEREPELVAEVVLERVQDLLPSPKESEVSA